MALDITTIIVIAIGISSFTVFVRRKDDGRIAFAIGAIFAWLNVLDTYFQTEVNQMLSNTTLDYGDIQALLLLVTVIAAIIGFIQQAM